MELWYDRPAARWTDALPGGNGRLGVMDDGGIERQTLWLNEDTFWSGYPRTLDCEDKSPHFRKIRELIEARQYQAAQALFEKEMSFFPGESYEPLGQLVLTYRNVPGGDYLRRLDLDTATLYSRQGGLEREALVSAPHQVAALHLTTREAGGLHVSLTLDGPLRHRTSASAGELSMLVQAPSLAEPNYSNTLAEPVQYHEEPSHQGIRAAVLVQVRHRGGTLTERDGHLILEGADEALILIAAQTSFRSWRERPDTPDQVLLERCRAGLDAAPDWEALREAHIRDYRQYFDRVTLSLGEDARQNVPTGQRLREFDPQSPDLGLYPLLFQYGRYLMISGSRPGTQALGLQGIWNHLVRPPWSGNYTLNINTEMNYWPALPCALEELQEPLTRLTEELAEAGRDTARLLYGAPGFAAHHNSDLWRFTWPVGDHTEGCTEYAFWYMAGPWLCGPLFKWYTYTLDKDFLAQRAYPVMRPAADFLLALLREDEDGTLVLVPGTSPENTFRHEGAPCALDRTTAMNMAIARELFQNCVTACQILDVDREWADGLRETLGRLRPHGVTESGALLEWYEPHPPCDVHHRHISHLYGVYPGDQITREDSPELMRACRQALEERGDEGTGWSMGWKACQWARHGEGDRALKLLNLQLRLVEDDGTHVTGGGSYANGFSAHPPFQIDGNFGFTAAVAEMLLRSCGERVHLLPALPKAWGTGRVQGLRGTGRVTVGIAWTPAGGEAVLRTDAPQRRMLCLPDGETFWADLLPGEAFCCKFRL